MKSTHGFSHVPYASDYMRIATRKVMDHFNGNLQGKMVLDIPAGNGWIGDELGKIGCKVISADINDERPDFTPVDMEKTLPFLDASFDAVICCEGIEHVFSPFHLFSELQRILRPSGILIVTTPNIQNLYSRIQYLCTGYLFQFDPFDKTVLNSGQLFDKGHVSPVGLTQLIYWSEYFNLRINEPSGSRYKKRWLLPLLLPVIMFGKLWAWNDWKKTINDDKRKFIIDFLFSTPVLLSRSVIFSATKL